MNKKSTMLLIAALLLGLGLGVLLARQGPLQEVVAPASAHEHDEGEHEEKGEGGHADSAESSHEEEGAITLSQEQIDLAGIELAAVGPRQLQRTLALPGRSVSMKTAPRTWCPGQPGWSSRSLWCSGSRSRPVICWR